MFADICGSAFLFSQLGDEKAVSLVSHLLDQAASRVEANDGTVLRSKGDDILCIFDQPADAIRAALDIHAHTHNFPATVTEALAMRIGINSGPALLSENDVFGEAVNIAARISSLAKAEQTIISSQTAALIDRTPNGLIRPMGEVSLKGIPGPVKLYELLASDEEDEITQVGAPALQIPTSRRLALRYQSHQVQLDSRLVRHLLGRADDCDLVLNHPLVSRHHAEIRYRNGEFVLIDFSTNGTELITNGESRSLHHTQAALRGTGSIFLGRTVYNRKFEIAFNTGGQASFNQTYT
jgi:hypothetical protein